MEEAFPGEKGVWFDSKENFLELSVKIVLKGAPP